MIALLTPVTYQASALLVIDQRITSPTADLNAAITTGQLLAAHYIKMATSTAVLDGVCADAGDCSANELKSHVSASAVKGTDLLSVTVTDSSPSGATNLANLVAAKLLAEHRREVAASLKPAKAYLDGELSRIWKELGSAKPQFVTVTQAAYTTAYNKREAVAEQEARMDGSLSLVSAAAIPTAPVPTSLGLLVTWSLDDAPVSLSRRSVTFAVGVWIASYSAASLTGAGLSFCTLGSTSFDSSSSECRHACGLSA